MNLPIESKQPNQSHQSVSFLQIDADQAGQRIDNFLVTHLKGVPKSHIYRILRKGEVRINKGRVKAEYKLQPNDVVRIPPIRVSNKPVPNVPSQGLTHVLEQSVLYEDKSLLIINKPSGLAVHGGSGINLGLIESLRQIRPQDRFLELVHRLDRETSGCIMVAKKRSMLRYLQDLLRKGQMKKVYHAVVIGEWPAHCVEVKSPLLKLDSPGGGRLVKVDARGKDSLTRFRVLERFRHVSLIEARPVTGRTHQIRVHAQSVGHPLIGDDKYGDDEINKQMRSLGLGRLCLHAVQLQIQLPDQEQPLVVDAPLDEDLRRAIERLPR